MIRKKRKSKDTRNIKNKVSLKEFVGVQLKVLKNLVSTYKVDSIIIIALLCTLTFTDVLNLKFIEYITNSASSLIKTKDKGEFNKIIITSSIFIMCILISYILNWIYERFNQRYKEKVRYDIEKNFKEKLSRISYEYLESNQFYEKVNRARSAGENYGDAIYGVSQFLKIIITMIMYSILLAKISFIFPILLMATSIITIYISGIVTDKQLDYWRKEVSPSQRKVGYFQGVIDNRVSQQCIQTGRLYSYFAGLFQKWNIVNMKAYFKLNLLSFTTELFSVVIQAIVYGGTVIYISKKVIAGTVDIGYFTMVTALLFNLFGIMKSYSYFILNGSLFVKTIEDYFDVMNTPTENSEYLSHNKVNKIEMKDIFYKYPQSEKYALKNLNISFSVGEKIAVVGHNGSGKTTLMGIVMGMFKSYEGEIYIDGKKIKRENINILSNNTSCLLQDFGQYQMTIKENIELGNKGIEMKDEEIIELLNKVSLYDYVKTLEKGIYTPLGQLDNGVELSKGQWQRLGVARLLANKEANIWVLDEPTAYLDPIAEIEMYSLIRELATSQLVFFISHRLGFAKKADRILVINEGELKEQGKHEELIEKQGLYYKMYDTQKEWYS